MGNLIVFINKEPVHQEAYSHGILVANERIDLRREA